METQETYKIYQASNDRKTNYGIGIPQDSSWFFELESDRFILVTDLNEADIVPIFSHVFVESLNENIKKIIKNKIILGNGVFHTDNEFTLDGHPFHAGWKNFTQKLLMLETNLINKKNTTINYDLLWNRQKLYFTEYNRINLSNRIWTYNSTEKTFKLNTIEKTLYAKRFLSLNRILFDRGAFEKNRRQYYRYKLAKKLEDTDNIFSDWTIDPPRILDTEEQLQSFPGSMWLPVANKIYENTFISIYVETLTNSFHTRVITEKTFDPLIKGHFILPFGYCGMIEDIKSYGFKLPTWINYEYDYEVDSEKRFNLFIQEFERLQNIEIQQYYKWFEKDYDLLVHNRNVFFNRPYDSLYPSLVKALAYV